MGLDYISDSMSPHEAMNAATSPGDAARIFVWIMERPNDRAGESDNRSGKAQKWLEYTKSISGGSGNASLNTTSDGSGITIIGDSVIATSSGKIKEKLPKADIYAESGKQLSSVKNDVQNLFNSKKFGEVVIFAIGTDSVINETELAGIVKLVGSSRKIIFVKDSSTKDDYIGNNNIFTHIAEQNSNVSVVDWNSDNKTEFFESDGVTLSVKGQEALASVLVSASTDAQDARDACIGGGAVEGGLTQEQAQKLADYYNSDAVDPYEWGFYAGTKVNCTAFSWWFAEYFTGLSWANGDAKNVAHNFAVAHGLPEGNEPRPFAIFAVDGPPLAFSQDCDGYCGHTGIVVAVEGDKVITVEAAWGAYSGMVKVHDKSDFINNTWGTAYTYLDSVIDVNKLNAIIGN